MSVDDNTTERPETETENDQTHHCARCDTVLTRASQHRSNNRETIQYSCPDCRVGAKAVVEQTGKLIDRCQHRLNSAQGSAMDGLSVYRVAAFVTDEFPHGRYTVERTDEHEFVVTFPETATQWDVLRLADRLSVGPLSATDQDQTVIVTDARWSDQSPLAVPDGGMARGQASDGTLSTTGTDPFAVAEDDEPRTKRAKREQMEISFLKKPGKYEVHAESGRYYDVDVVAETCTCPDFQQACNDPDVPVDRCKHLRRVAIEIEAGLVPRPDGKLPDM